MSKTIEVWWIRWGDDRLPCLANGLAITPSELHDRLPDVWFSAQEVLNDPRLLPYLKRVFKGLAPDRSWGLVSTQIEFTEEELNEALHHRR